MKLNGWKKVGPVVWEHTSGVRAHAGGYCRITTGVFLSGHSWPQSKALRRFKRIAGSGVRGILAWSLAMERLLPRW